MGADPLYTHIRVVLGIILGLGITKLLQGIALLIEQRRHHRVAAVHLIWVAWALISIVTFWWWEFRLAGVTGWTFGTYLFIIAYCAMYFMVATLLFPTNVAEYGSYEQYLIERRPWFFGLIAAITLMDLADTALKGQSQWQLLGQAYPAHTAFMLVIAGIGIWRREHRVQLTIAVLTLVYQVSYFTLEYFRLGPE